MTNHFTAPVALPTSSTARPLTFGPGGLTASDAQRVAAAIDAALADSTRTAYASAWRVWETWCRRRGIAALPAAPEALAAYLAERAESGICFGTLDGACSAIAHRHHQEGLPDPTAHVVVRRVRRGLRRIMGTAPRRQAHPLTVGELDRLVSKIDPLPAIGIRDRAVILLGYASALRPGELSALDLADIIAKPAGVLVAVRRSKTDQDGHGQLVGVARGEHRRTDPIRALDAWLEIRPAGQGALFTRGTDLASWRPSGSAPEQSADSFRHGPSPQDSRASR
jgi:integrase